MRIRYFTPVVFSLVVASVLITTPAQADLGDQLAKLLPDDVVDGDRFGFSVAISGTTVIVGAYGDDDNGDWSGSAYLLDTRTGMQIAKLLPDDGATTNFFGISVGISGATAIVGADGDDDNGTNSGSAYLFDTTTGSQIAKLLPDDGAEGDNFGISVAISGATAIVGAELDDDNGSESGSAYLFDISDPKNPVQISKLLPNDGAAFDWFGISVAISGTTAIVGARLDDDNGLQSGSAYLFDISDPKNPVEIFKLLPNDGAAGDRFGNSVAISGASGMQIAIVGAFRDDDNGGASGSAYLFDATTGQQIAKLLPDDGAGADFFGVSVAISGSTVIVGAEWNDDNGADSGSAYLFDISEPANPAQVAKLLPSDGAAGDEFGGAVAISGATAIGGAWGDDDNGLDSGSAYLFSAIIDIEFDPPEEFAAVGEPINQAVADFTGDVTNDVIVTVPGDDPLLAGAVQIFLNQGIDEFDVWLGLSANTFIPVGREPSGVAVGLFNNDEFVDFAVSNAGDNNVLVFINQGTGKGTFNLPVTVDVGQRPSDVIAGDFNGDSFLDLAVANADDNNVWILFNDGGGGFAKGAMLPTNGLLPMAIDPEDLDDDKDLDIVGINGLLAPGFKGGTPGSVFVLINNGNGTFQSAVTHEIGIGPLDLSVGDLNRDGFAEIVVVNNVDATVSVLVNQGDGTFISDEALSVGTAPTSIEAVDLDADGDLDLAIVADDIEIGLSVQVIQNVGVDPGELFFDVPLAFGVDADPNFVISTDFNEDFVNDLVTVNADEGKSGGSVTVLLNVQCPWDLNENGTVGTPDLLLLFAQWGSDPGGPPDFNGDGTVNTIDLLILFANWGLCP